MTYKMHSALGAPEVECMLYVILPESAHVVTSIASIASTLYCCQRFIHNKIAV